MSQDHAGFQSVTASREKHDELIGHLRRQLGHPAVQVACLAHAAEVSGWPAEACAETGQQMQRAALRKRRQR